MSVMPDASTSDQSSIATSRRRHDERPAQRFTMDRLLERECDYADFNQGVVAAAPRRKKNHEREKKSNVYCHVEFPTIVPEFGRRHSVE